MGEGNARLAGIPTNSTACWVRNAASSKASASGEADIFARENDNAAGQAFGLAKLVSKAWVSPEGGQILTCVPVASKGLQVFT